MIKDFSYGVIPVRFIQATKEIYLVKNKNGSYWGFPKGHAEGDEKPVEAAERELIEETGLEVVRWLSAEPIDETYIFGHQGKLIEKKVFYFIAEVTKVAVIQRDEILDGAWVKEDEVLDLLTYDASKKVYRDAQKILNEPS